MHHTFNRLRRGAQCAAPAMFVLASVALFCPAPTATAQTGQKTLAIILPTLKISVLQTERKAAVDEAKRLGYRTTVLTHDFNTEKELRDAEQIITEKVAGVAWNVADPASSYVAVAKVRAAGIPVVNMDRVLTKRGVANAAVESDNFQCGALAAKAFVDMVGQHGTYAELAGKRADPMARTRSAGYHSVLDKVAGLKMVAKQSGAWSETSGFRFAGSILQAHPDILGFVTGNDSIGLGAAAAIKSQRKKHMVVVGIDGGHAGVSAVESGTSPFRATAAQPVIAEARKAVDIVDTIIRTGKSGLTPAQRLQLIPCTLVEKKK